MSPFLVCAIIFVRIFWSSEQTQLRYVKRKEGNSEQKKVEQKHPKIPNIRNHEFLCKCPSQNVTSRRRNFSDKKWDMYGGLEEKANDLSVVFHNEFTKRNTKSKGFDKFFEKGGSFLDNRLSGKKKNVPKRQTLRSEPSMVDLVECGDLVIEKIKDGDEEDGEEAQEDRNKVIGWTEDDQKNLMYLGISEIERNKRLESLIARRKEKKLFIGQHEKCLIDKKPMAKVLTKISNPLDFSKDFEDGFETPSSAPSFMATSPYEIPYDPYEEKPNLTRGSFSQEISSQKNMPFCRHESFSSDHFFLSQTNQDHGSKEHYSFSGGRKYSNRIAHSRFKRHTDKGTHDWIIDQLIYNESATNPLENGEETTYVKDIKCKTKMDSMKVKEVRNDHLTKSKLDQVSEANLVPNISNIENDGNLEKSRLGSRFPRPHGRLLNFPVSTNASNTNINEALYDNVTYIIDKRQENMFLSHGRLCHTPTYSVASDLQVEVSEVGSLTSTIGENVETNSSTDRESIHYDGDVDRDVSSGSEELWGTSFKGGKEEKKVRSEGDDVEVNNNSNEVVPPFTPHHIDEENAINMSSIPSKYDVLEDISTRARNNHHNNFGYKKHLMEEIEVPQSSNSSHALDQLPSDTNTKKLEEWCNNLPDIVTNGEHVINEVNNTTTIEQGSIENLGNNEDSNTLVMQHESMDDTSINSVSSSPRSVLPEKTMVDEVSLSVFDQQILVGAQQSIVEVTTQETLDNEVPFDIRPQIIQPSMDDNTHDQLDIINFNNSQEQTIPLENSIEESNIFGSINNEEVNIKTNHDEYIMEGRTQETLDHESPSNSILQIVQQLMDDTTHELHNVDFNHSQKHTILQENSIEEPNIFDNMHHAEVINKEKHNKYITEDITQETLNESPSNTIPQTIQPLADITTHKSHNVDSNNSQERTMLPIEPNVFDNTSDEGVNNKSGDDMYIMESMTQKNLDSESSSNTMPQIIQPLIDDTTPESHNVDFNHSQDTKLSSVL
ncbi:hypothetical protein Fmac_014154 [Flemingia macrophylla]|uniref:Uncharacterized protein n=1 Tax=Flemingia macrophylla TaxID=520843 RepID=A0ABD1MAY5_9FABA